ncbi:MAG: zinc metallopeptidase [Planctomycetales bacterium 12-60-4]|nr:MAG: zinc metallopeptidase [Planctomycetales bacterium 12-60-4]
MIGFDFLYFLFIAPAVLLAMWAQARVHSSYNRAMQEPAPLSGAAAARLILDQAGLQHIPIEEVPGTLSDHYDPSTQTVRLSSAVYRERSLAAVGIAAHEVGHAIQHAHQYLPLVVRNLAVPAATVGPNVSFFLILAGVMFTMPGLIWLGIIAFSGLAVFQIVNLPVEFDASARAKRVLSELQIVDSHGAAVVRDVLGAAAWTYVAATLQTLLTLLYYIVRYGGMGRRD